MNYYVNFSMGVCSAYIACRWQDEGLNPVCVFSDTKQEDSDTYRFGYEVVRRWGLNLVDASDGRKLFELFEESKMIPARQIPSCSIALKILPSQRFYKNEPDGFIAYGYDMDEIERSERTSRLWNLDGKEPVYPLQDWEISKSECMGYFLAHNVAIPRVYQHFNHANCMPCKNFRVNDWKALKFYYPEVFNESLEFETRTGLKFMQDGPFLSELPEEDFYSRKGRRPLTVPAFSFDMGCDRCAVD